MRKHVTKDGLFKASPTTNAKLPSKRKDRWSVVVSIGRLLQPKKSVHFPKALKDQGKKYGKM